MELTNTNFSVVFPGQGSQALEMGKELAAAFPAAKQVFEQAGEVLGQAFSQIMWDGPEDALNDTFNTQPALLIHSMAAWAVFKEKYPDAKPSYMAGHSLGELSALTAAGALSFEDGLKLVRRRGELMKQAGEVAPGRMAAILGLDIATVEGVCEQAGSETEIVQVANDNCPGQVVVSGHQGAIDRVVELAKEAGAKRAIPLAVSIATHSQLMTRAQEEFNQAVDAAGISEPNVPVIGNVSAQPLASVAEIQADLKAQLTNRVRWTESVTYMAAQGSKAFIEVGSGNVLTGLIRRINRDVERAALGKPEDFEGLGN